MTIKVTPSVLSDTTVAAGTYGGSTTIPSFTTDAQGRLISAGNTGISLSSTQVTNGLGFTPYNATNPSGFTNNTGTVTSVGGTGTVNGLTLSGTVTGSGNLTLGGTLTLTSTQVTNGLGFTPYNATNPSGYITGINSAAVTGALGYTPYNSTNPAGYQTASGSVDYADRARFATSANTATSAGSASTAGSAGSVTGALVWRVHSTSAFTIQHGIWQNTNCTINDDFELYMIKIYWTYNGTWPSYYCGGTVLGGLSGMSNSQSMTRGFGLDSYIYLGGMGSYSENCYINTQRGGSGYGDYHSNPPAIWAYWGGLQGASGNAPNSLDATCVIYKLTS